MHRALGARSVTAMSLAGYQHALGTSIRMRARDARAPASGGAALANDLTRRESASLEVILASPGFDLTVAVQRSWCESRAATTARQTLSVLPAEQRQRLLREWVTTGGGTRSFVASEAEAFLEFIARRLPEPS